MQRSLLQDDGGPSDILVESHGVLMAVVFVAVLPLSAVIAATFRKAQGSNTWFQVHRTIGIIAALIVVVGLALGIVAWQQSQPASDLLYAHIVIGALIFAFAILQAGTALAAPVRKNASLRRWWRPAHQFNGRLLLLLGLANTFIGIYEAEADNSWYIWVCIVWVAIVGFGVGKAIYNRRSGQVPLAAGSSTPANAATAKANVKAHSSVEMP